MNYEDLYKEEVRQFNIVISDFDALSDEDIAGAFKLMKESLQAYNRWAQIKCDIKKDLGRGEASAIKNRLEEICRYLKEVHITSRMIWAKARDEYRNNREE